MPTIGRIGSFATVEAPKDPLLDTLQNIEQVGFQKRAEDRLLAEKKKLEEEKQLAEDVAWDGKFDPTIVGNSKIDDPMLAMSFKAKDEVGQIRRQLKNQSLPYQEKVRLNSRLNKISQSFNVANQTPKIILDKAKEIAKNIDKYDPDDISIIEGISKQLETGKYEMNYDENGTARIKIFKTDESGKPIGILKETTLADLANEFQPHMKSNYQSLLKEAVGNTAVAETEIQKGLTTTTNKGVVKDVASANAKAFGEYIANTPSEAYAVAKRKKIDENDKEQIAEIAAQEFKNSLDTTYKVKTDFTEARLRAEAAGKKKEQEIIIAKPTEIKKEGEIVNGVNLQKGTKSFPLGKVIIDSGQGKQQKATNVYVSPKGKMYLRIEETGFEAGSQKQTVYTESGKKKVDIFKAENEKLKKEGKPEKPISSLQLDFGDTKDVSVSEKKPVVKMLDFGKDQGEIGRYAIRMGYDGAGEMTNDFIERSGGQNFIITPGERNQPKKTILRSQIVEKAKAAGYSTKEYEKLLMQNGIKIQ